MELKTIKKIFDFIKEKEGREAPFIWKLLNNEPFKEEDLIIKIDLDLRFRKVPPLPKGLNVGGNLFLQFSTIESLPEGLEVGGDLKLSQSTIKSLPEGLTVWGHLDLSRTEIKSLPKGIEVWGDLDLSEADLPFHYDSNDHLRRSIEPGFIKGDIKTEYSYDDDDDDDDD